MSPEQLITVWYDIEFTRFARDYKNYNTFFLLDRNGARRERKAYRSRICPAKRRILITRIMPYFFARLYKRRCHAQHGQYRNPDREREQWLYLPSMRKARRSSPAEDDENTLGTVLTVEEMTSWRPNMKISACSASEFPGYASIFDKSSITGVSAVMLSRQCPKEKMRYGQNESSGCALVMGAAFSRKFMTKTAKCIKTIFRRFDEIRPNRYPAIVLVEAKICAPVKEQ